MSVSVSEEALLQVVAETLNIPKGRLCRDSKRESIVEWDSLGHIMLMLAIEQKFSVKFSADQIRNIRGLADIKTCLPMVTT